MTVIRDYGADGLSIVIGVNTNGRVEPFVFLRRDQAEWLDQTLRKAGVSVLTYHGIEVVPTIDDISQRRLEKVAKEMANG